MKKHIFTFASLLAVSILGCYPVHGMNPLTPDEVKELGDRFGLGRNFDTNKEKESYSWAKKALSEGIMRGDVETVSRIVRTYKGIVNSDIESFDGYSKPLIYACELCEPRFDMVKVLLQNGANVNATELSSGRTALHVNIASPKIIDLLLEHGADISARDDHGRTVLFGKENVIVVCQLIKEGVNTKAVNEWSETALHAACSRTFYTPEVIGILAEVSDVNAKDKFGQTPLHLLVKNADIFERRDNEVSENVRVLLRKGADPSIRDSIGRTPLDLVDKCSSAQTEGEAEVAALLRAAMEK